jgi:putative transposase
MLLTLVNRNRLTAALRRPAIAELGSLFKESHRRAGLDRFLRRAYRHLRPHMSLDHNAPEPRAVEGPERGRVVAEPMVGGLHHRYRRCA